MKIIFLLCAYVGFAIQSHAGELCGQLIPLVLEADVLPKQSAISLRHVRNEKEISKEARAVAIEDAHRSGFNVTYYGGIDVADHPGYYLVFTENNADDAYIAYYVVNSSNKPLYKFKFGYIFMPQTPDKP